MVLPAAIGIAASEALTTGSHKYNTRKHGKPATGPNPMLKVVVEGAIATAGGLALAHHEKKKNQRSRSLSGPESSEDASDPRLKKLVEGGLATAAAVMVAHHEHKESKEQKRNGGGHRRRPRRGPY
jgi:hypothetical protein